MNRILFLFIGLWSCAVHAQDIVYARKVIDTLASPSMHGRGYVNAGDKKAADFIAAEFRNAGLLELKGTQNYFQHFSFPVNTFPGDVELTLHFKNGNKVSGDPGEMFLVRSASPSVKGHFKVVRLDSSVVADESRWNAFIKAGHKKEFVLVDTTGIRDKKQLSLLTNYVKYPVNVKGILLPVRMNSIEGSDHCSKLTPWDFSLVQSGTPVIEIEHIHRFVTEIDIKIGAKFIRNYTSQNVVGYIKGSEVPDSFIVFTAHYDHLGRMGKNVYFPGANDNASGVAMLLSLVKHYSSAEHRPRHSIVFIAFGAEEVGLIGSRYFTQHPLVDLNKIDFLINMDILGTGDEGITVVNATIWQNEFKELQKLNAQGSYLPQIKPRGKAAISDHYFFTEAGVKCFYFYTLGGIKAYHDTCDRRETLPLTRYEPLFLLIRDFTDWLDHN
ncbi:MAG: hypothetical protein Fur0041_02340 [Bacteroidia bacterium]